MENANKKCLVLGGEGMLGHMLVNYLKSKSEFEVFFTSRNKEKGIYFDVIEDITKIEEIIEEIRPSLVINCIGIVNSLIDSKGKDVAVFVNSYFPQRLARICSEKHVKMIHISTDCVFSGKDGNYTENSEYSSTDFYGLSKAAGEVIDNKNLTIRTSIIGPEIKEPKTGLMEWFFSQKGQEVQGFSKAIWSGVTTLELSKKIVELYEKEVTGLITVASDPISKYDLLFLIKEVFDLNTNINKELGFFCDRSMKSIREGISLDIPSHKEMLVELKKWMEKHVQ